MIRSLLLISLLTVGICPGSAFAGCVGPVVMGECKGTEIPGIAGTEPETKNFEGSSGAKYQYDLNDPGDKIQYSVDLDAQRRDQMNLNPGRNLDRNIGQHGGGIKND